MRPKRGVLFFLLIVACVTVAEPPDDNPKKKKSLQAMTKKMMKKCLKKGHAVPEMEELKAVFDNSDLPMVGKKQMNIFLSRFFKIMGSDSAEPRRKGPKPDQPDKMANKMWNCSNLPPMIRLIRNSSEATACYMQAYVAPLALKALTPRSECNMTSEDYDALLWAVKPLLKEKSFNYMELPSNLNAEMISKLLNETRQEKLSEALHWGKDHITQKYFNCTTRPPSDSRTHGMERCEPSLPWLNSEALDMIGPDIYSLEPSDVDYATKDELCKFLLNNGFKNATTVRRKKKKKMPPSLSEKFWEKFQDCFEGNIVLTEHLDKLSILACKHIDASSLSSDLSLDLLSDPDICKQLKKRIIRSQMSKMNTEDLHKWGNSANLLPPKVLNMIPVSHLDQVVRNRDIIWKVRQQRILAWKLCDNKCKNMPGEKLIELRSIVRGFPNSAFVNVKEVLNNTEGLSKLSRYMNSAQRMVVLERLSRSMGPSQLVPKLPEPLLCVLPLNKMDQLSITSDLEEKTWCPPQAAYIAKEMLKGKKQSFSAKKLRSLLRGVACERINNVPSREVEEMVQDITDAPKWLTKNLAGCVAKRLFTVLEKKRANYFETITEEELDNIPTCLLLRLPPLEVKDLPDSLCPALLDKLEDADLSSLPRRSQSLPALTQRALLCLGEDLSVLTYDDVLSLGPFLCELWSSQLRLMAPDVLKSTLAAMATCKYIPERNRADIIELVKETFGDPSLWSQETMETLGPLILWDDNAISALPNTPWMYDVLSYLMEDRKHISQALREKLFQLATKSAANRYTRAADTEVLTEDDIDELGTGNIYWSPEKLDQISNDTFINTIEILGAIPDFDKEQLGVLCPKAKILLKTGAITLNQMGCLLRCYNIKELKELPLSLDDLEVIAICKWDESQVKAVWKTVAKNNNLTAETLDGNTMVSLNRFICGLSSSQIQQLSEEAFKSAAGSIDVCQCSFEVLPQFKDRAVSAFGSPETWSEAQMSELGCIVAGLNGTELASLDPSVVSFINDSCIPIIPPNNFAAFSVEQLEALKPESGDKVTDKQKEALVDEQKDALERATTGTITLKQRSSVSGAPSLSVEGIAAVMKPLLFLLMGFLLL